MAKKKPKPGDASAAGAPPIQIRYSIQLTPELIARLDVQARRFHLRRAGYIKVRLISALEADEASAGT